MLCVGLLLDGVYVGILEAFASPASKPNLRSSVFDFGELPVFLHMFRSDRSREMGTHAQLKGI